MLHFLLFAVCSGQMLYNSPVQDQTISAALNQEVEYQLNDTVVSVDLYLKTNDSILELRNYDDYMEEGAEDALDGCFAKQKRFVPDIYLQLKSSSETFSDFVYLADLARGYIVTEEFDLIEFVVVNDDKIIKSPQKRNFASFLKVPSSGKSPIFIEEFEGTLYILSNFGALSLSSQNLITSRSFGFKLAPLNHCKDIKNVFTDSNVFRFSHYPLKQLISIACGYDGAFVYDFMNDLALVNHINETSINVTSANVMSSKIYEAIHFVLDYEHGITLIQQSKILLRINISRAFAFDYYDQTLLVMAKSSIKQNYAAEIFLETDFSGYRINKYFYQEISLYNAEIYKDFAVLIGYDAHRIILHSVYTGFLRNEAKSFFEMSQLLRVKEVYLKETYLLGAISPHMFAFISIEKQNAKIVCNSQREQTTQYWVSLNATKCFEKSHQYDLSKFTACDSNFTIRFEVTDNRSFAEKNDYLIAGILLLLTILTLFAIYYCYRKWGKNLRYLLRKKDRLMEQKKLDLAVQELTYTSSS